MPKRAPKGTPNVLFIVLDDTGFGSWAATAARSRHRTWSGRRRKGLRYNNMHTTAQCSPSRSCIITGATITATPWPASPSSPLASRLRRQRAVRELLLRDPAGARLQHLHGGQVAPDPSSQESAAGPSTVGLLAGFERFYGFLGGDTSQWNPDLVYDNHQIDPPATAEQGYHLTPDLVDKIHPVHRRRQAGRPGQALLPALLHWRDDVPHHVPKEWADKTPGSSMNGSDAYRTGTFARQKEPRHRPGRLRALPPRPDVPDWELAVGRRASPVRGEMEVFAGFLSDTDHHIGPPRSSSCASSASSTTR